MRRAATIATTVGAALMLTVPLTACDDLDAALDPDATLRADTSGSPAPPPPPTTGRALLTIDGDRDGSLVFGALTDPARYAGGEGPASLVWRTSSYELLTLSGDLRLGAQPTSETLGVQLAIEVGRDVVAFTSDDGSCSVTVARAEPRAVSGDIACTGLTTADGEITIDVSGTFQAGRRDG